MFEAKLFKLDLNETKLNVCFQHWKAVVLTLNVFYSHDLMTIWNAQFGIIVISSYFYDWMQSILTFCLVNNFILIKILIAIYSQA